MLERVAAGELPAKHHIVFRDANGALLHEECLTRQGFDGPYSLLYHINRPHTHVPRSAGLGWTLPDASAMALRKRLYLSDNVMRLAGPPAKARVPLLFNADVVLSLVRPNASDTEYFSNGDGDEILFVHKGAGVLRSAFGDLRFGENDYLCIPKGVVHRFELDEDVEQQWLHIECLGGVGLPKQWRTDTGQLRMDAPFCHRDFRKPEFKGPQDEGIRELTVKRGNAFHGFAYEHSPLDVVGWDGSVYPWAFNILNFQPRAGLVHLPPDWHGTFAARGALICSFVPRTVDFHPNAIPCPYPHSSVDCDEILYYVRGSFTSRRGVGPGAISLHPAGLAHGPHPGAYEASIGSKTTDELAVMMDTFLPLRATTAATQAELAGYHDSFR